MHDDTNDFLVRIARARQKRKGLLEWAYIATLLISLIVGLAILYGLI